MTNMAQKPLPATPKNVGTICKMKTKNTENTYKKDNQEHYVKEENEDTTDFLEIVPNSFWMVFGGFANSS